MTASPSLRFALCYRSDLSSSQIHALLARWQEAGGDDEAALLAGGPEGWRELGLNGSQRAGLQQAADAHSEALRELRAAELAGLQVLCSGQAAYPAALQERLGNARPPLLFASGNVELLREPGISIVGSRRCLPESLEFTRAAAGPLARHGIVVVSGYAEGVDRAASEEALEADGATILVLAQGLLTFGRGRTQLGEWIDQGRLLVLSAFEPRAEWSTPRAMSRNHSIAALGRELIVSQAGASGGSWETARIALHQGNRVWVRQADLPELGHTDLHKLGAHPLPWPDPNFAEWIDQTTRRLLEGRKGEADETPWEEQTVMQLLREGSAAEIHDACGITGHLLTRLLDGRGQVSLTTLNDLRKIKGLGAAATEDIRRAFGLSAPPEPQLELPLFPEVEEFPGWDGELRDTRSEPQTDAPKIEEQDAREIEQALGGEADHSEEKPSPANKAGHTAPKNRPRNRLLLLNASGLRADVLLKPIPGLNLPNLQRLRQESAEATQTVAAACFPAAARASLFTGLTPRAHGLQFPGQILPETTRGMAAHLAANGFRTAHVGRLRFSPYEAPPSAKSKESIEYWASGVMDNWNGPYHGFNQLRLIVGEGADSLRGGHYGQWLEQFPPAERKALLSAPARPSPTGCLAAAAIDVPDARCPLSWCADRCIDFLQQLATERFFISCTFPAPEPPYLPLANFLDSLPENIDWPPIGGPQDLEQLPPIYLKAAHGDIYQPGLLQSQPSAELTKEMINDIRRHYLATLLHLDREVGRILDTLEELDIANETLIAFTADCADMLGDHGLLGSGPFHHQSLWHLPLILRLPETIPPGHKVQGPVSQIDILPTLCALLDIEIPPGTQGMPLDDCFAKQRPNPRKHALCEYLNPDPPYWNSLALLTQDQTLAQHPADEKTILFDRSRDPDEAINHWTEISPEERARLQALLLDEILSTQPTPRPPLARA